MAADRAHPTKAPRSGAGVSAPRRGRAAAIVNPRLVEDGAPVGQIGLFACDEHPDTARRLLDAACTWLDKRGCRVVRGPMNFSTWYDYRLVTRATAAGYIPGEPYHPAHYPALFEAAGFKPVATYTQQLAGRDNIDKPASRRSACNDEGYWRNPSCAISTRLPPGPPPRSTAWILPLSATSRAARPPRLAAGRTSGAVLFPGPAGREPIGFHVHSPADPATTVPGVQTVARTCAPRARHRCNAPGLTGQRVAGVRGDGAPVTSMAAHRRRAGPRKRRCSGVRAVSASEPRGGQVPARICAMPAPRRCASRCCTATASPHGTRHRGPPSVWPRSPRACASAVWAAAIGSSCWCRCPPRCTSRCSPWSRWARSPCSSSRARVSPRSRAPSG